MDDQCRILHGRGQGRPGTAHRSRGHFAYITGVNLTLRVASIYNDDSGVRRLPEGAVEGVLFGGTDEPSGSLKALEFHDYIRFGFQPPSKGSASLDRTRNCPPWAAMTAMDFFANYE